MFVTNKHKCDFLELNYFIFVKIYHKHHDLSLAKLAGQLANCLQTSSNLSEGNMGGMEINTH